MDGDDAHDEGNNPSEGCQVGETGYKPPKGFQLDERKQSIVDLTLTDSTELWLIQWPLNQPPDFDGQEVSLKLNHDGKLGSFEGLSGKQYDVFSFASQEPNATVFSDSKVVGKISRRVSLVHYPEPDELEEGPSKNQKNMYLRSSGTSLTHSSHHHATPSQGTVMKNSRWSRAKGTSLGKSRSSSSQGTSLWNGRSSSGSAGSKLNSRQSSLSEVGDPSPQSSKKRPVQESIGSMDRSTLDTERGHRAGASSGSVGHSDQKRAKKMRTEK